ncbi:DNA binding, phage related protein [Bifidobacterium tissieri]|uniref:DNA binding, phage related protein n=1 Tax=Bifidobacterium tissieri TaxID=1630162 RepID=A0A261FFA5_9BIFI|nr:recombinase RecT [Bifidobacterium tissieri]OZG57829.1 DNA binding, phage related protein [Bifidobacterium tissieri]
MGQLAQATQGRQLTANTTERDIRDMVRASWPQIQRVIGGNLKPDMLLQYCISSINREPALRNCTPVSVLSCFMQCAALGLKPSNVDGLGQAYILPYGNKNHQGGQPDATFVIGYKGMLKLLENSGIYAQPVAVYEDDGVKLRMDAKGTPYIECPDEINLDADHSPGKLKFVFLSIDLPNGGTYAAYMSRKDLEAYRDLYAPRSKRRGNAISGPWATNFVEMGLKTLIRRSFKYLPVSVEAKTATTVDETTPDYSDVLTPQITDAMTTVVDTTPDNESEAEPESGESAQADQREAKLSDLIDRFKALGVASEQEACQTVSKIVNRPVSAFTDMSEAEIDKVLNDFDPVPDTAKDGE